MANGYGIAKKGKIDSIFNYESGLLNGESKIFNNGSIVSRSFYKENVLEGKYNLYYPNGKNKTKGHYMDNVPNGKWTWFDEKNNKSRIVNYSMGKMNGPIKVWNDSSFLIMDGAYDQNLKNDKWIYYDSKGKRDSTLSYVKGKRYGEYKAWHDNGNISVSGSFFDDKKNKKWNWFSDNKTLDSSKTFNLGELDGPAVFSFKNGRTKKELTTNRPELMV